MRATGYIVSSILALTSMVMPCHAADKQPVVVVELTQTGKALEAKYAGMLETLKADLTKQIPTIDQAKVGAWLEAIKAEQGPEKEAVAKAKEVEKLQGAEGKLRD